MERYRDKKGAFFEPTAHFLMCERSKFFADNFLVPSPLLSCNLSSYLGGKVSPFKANWSPEMRGREKCPKIGPCTVSRFERLGGRDKCKISSEKFQSNKNVSCQILKKRTRNWWHASGGKLPKSRQKAIKALSSPEFLVVPSCPVLDLGIFSVETFRGVRFPILDFKIPFLIGELAYGHRGNIISPGWSKWPQVPGILSLNIGNFLSSDHFQTNQTGKDDMIKENHVFHSFWKLFCRSPISLLSLFLIFISTGDP